MLISQHHFVLKSCPKYYLDYKMIQNDTKNGPELILFTHTNACSDAALAALAAVQHVYECVCVCAVILAAVLSLTLARICADDLQDDAAQIGRGGRWRKGGHRRANIVDCTENFRRCQSRRQGLCANMCDTFVRSFVRSMPHIYSGQRCRAPCDCRIVVTSIFVWANNNDW